MARGRRELCSICWTPRPSSVGEWPAFLTVAGELGELCHHTGGSFCPGADREPAPAAHSVLTAPVRSKKQELLGEPVLAGHGGDLGLLGPMASQTEPVGQQAVNSETGGAQS